MAKKKAADDVKADGEAKPAKKAEGAASAPRTKKKAEAAAAPAPAEAPVQAVAAPAPVAEAAVAAAPSKPASAGPVDAPSAGRKRLPGRSPRRGKRLRNQMKNQMQRIAKDGALPVRRAISLLKQMKRAKFDETVEVHMWLGIDATQNDQNIRGSVTLPHGIGKSVRVVVFCQGDDVAKAKEAGADFAGSDDLIKKIQSENWLEFDVALATQSMMGQVSRLGKVLGPRGLMPTPKAGTVITTGQDVPAVVREFKAGKVEYRSDKGGNVHAGVGKLSFDEEKLVGNVDAFIHQIQASKPASVKGHFIRSVTLSATMSPGIPLQV